MGELSSGLITLLTQLMPGFLAAWVLYGLTSYPKPSQFERVIQALIFSFLIQAIVPIEKWLFIQLGKVCIFGYWNSDSEVILSAITGILFGLISSYYANNDKLYSLGRRLKLTKRTAYPSEWFGAFTEKVTFVVLHLKGSRRIMGWPVQWPSEPNNGHFELTLAAWLDDNNNETGVDSRESILIPTGEVEMVEFTKIVKELQNGTETAKS